MYITTLYYCDLNLDLWQNMDNITSVSTFFGVASSKCGETPILLEKHRDIYTERHSHYVSLGKSGLILHGWPIQRCHSFLHCAPQFIYVYTAVGGSQRERYTKRKRESTL